LQELIFCFIVSEVKIREHWLALTSEFCYLSVSCDKNHSDIYSLYPKYYSAVSNYVLLAKMHTYKANQCAHCNSMLTGLINMRQTKASYITKGAIIIKVFIDKIESKVNTNELFM